MRLVECPRQLHDQAPAVCRCDVSGMHSVELNNSQLGRYAGVHLHSGALHARLRCGGCGETEGE